MMTKIFNSIVFRTVINAIIIILLVIAIIMNLPVFTGYKVFAVVSGSMEPTIPYGALIIVKPQESYEPGDAVTFRSTAEPVRMFTHRIVSIENGRAVTKGDANTVNDPEPSSLKRAVGKVKVTVPLLGYPVMALERNWVRAAVAAFIILWIALEIELARRRRKSRIDAAADSENGPLEIQEDPNPTGEPEDRTGPDSNSPETRPETSRNSQDSEIKTEAEAIAIPEQTKGGSSHA